MNNTRLTCESWKDFKNTMAAPILLLILWWNSKQDAAVSDSFDLGYLYLQVFCGTIQPSCNCCGL